MSRRSYQRVSAIAAASFFPKKSETLDDRRKIGKRGQKTDKQKSDKLEARKQRNRESALASRKRKNDELEYVTNVCDQLLSKLSSYEDTQDLTEEIEGMKKKIRTQQTSKMNLTTSNSKNSKENRQDISMENHLTPAVVLCI